MIDFYRTNLHFILSRVYGLHAALAFSLCLYFTSFLRQWETSAESVSWSCDLDPWPLTSQSRNSGKMMTDYLVLCNCRNRREWLTRGGSIRRVNLFHSWSTCLTTAWEPFCSHCLASELTMNNWSGLFMPATTSSVSLFVFFSLLCREIVASSSVI